MLTQLSVVIIALGVALAFAALMWRRRARRLNSENPEERCRRDIQAMRRGYEVRVAEPRSGDVWSAGAEPDPAQSRAKKATTWVVLGSTGGCGGCGGCGCGG